jgi:hypothetical protein
LPFLPRNGGNAGLGPANAHGASFPQTDVGNSRGTDVPYNRESQTLPRETRHCNALVVGAFRVDAARAGAAAEVEPLVDELCRLSAEFKAMWRDNDVRSHGEGVKHIRHPLLGPLAFEYSAFAVDGRPDLSMVVYNPATPADAEKIRSLTGSVRALERT